MKITAYAATIGDPSGAHQKSSGSTRSLPRMMKASTRAMFDGLKTCPLRKRTDILRQQPERRNAREEVPAAKRPVVTVLRADHPQEQRGAAARLQRACRPREHPRAPERDRHFDRRAGEHCDQDLSDGHLEAEPGDPEDEDGEGDHRQMDSRVTDVGRYEAVRAAADAKLAIRRHLGVHWVGRKRGDGHRQLEAMRKTTVEIMSPQRITASSYMILPRLQGVGVGPPQLDTPSRILYDPNAGCLARTLGCRDSNFRSDLRWSSESGGALVRHDQQL